MDALWCKGSARVKEMLASELCSHEAALGSDQYGHFIASKMFLSTFKRGKEDWKRMLESQDKKREAMKEFLTEMKVKQLDKKSSVSQPSLAEGTSTNASKADEPKPPSPKKKKKAASYLDDL